MRYVLYARKSSEGEDKQVQSIEDQIRKLREKARNMGITVAKKDIFVEEKSAKKPNNRPVFSSVLKLIETGKADGILCWQINRLSRNPIDSGRIQWLLQQGTIKSILTYDKEYLPNDNAILFSVESGMANQYILELRVNTKRGIESKVQKGWLPALAPVGYLNDKYGEKGSKTITKDPERFDTVRKMWDLMLTGCYSPNQVLDIATENWGFRTREFKRRGGTALSYSGIYRLFTNKFYMGKFDYLGQEYEGNHEPMVTAEEFARVQGLIRKKDKAKPQSQEFSFTGNIKCGECGCLITAEAKTKFVKSTSEYKTYVYYRCTRKKRHQKCQQKPVRLEELDSQIAEKLKSVTIIPEFRDWALRILNEENDQEIKERTQIQKSLSSKLLDSQRYLDNLTQLRYRDLISDDEFVRERRQLQGKIKDLESELTIGQERARNWFDLTERVFYFANGASELFQRGGVRTKRELFSAMGQSLTLTDGEFELEFNDWFKPIEKSYKRLEIEYKKVRTEKAASPHLEMTALTGIYSKWGE